MHIFETLRGKLIDLAALTPDEQSLFLVFFDRAGGAALLNETVDPKQLLDPSAFRSLSQSTTRINTFNPERSLNGPLGEIVFDLSLRIGILKGWWTREAIRTDPHFSLREIYERCENGFTDSEGSGLERSQRSKFIELCRRPDVSITEVRDVLKEVGWTLEPKPLKRSTLYLDEDQLTCRDLRQMHLARRILMVASFVQSRPLLDRFLGREFIARVRDDPHALQQHIQFEQALAMVTSAGLVGLDQNLLIIGVQRDVFAQHAWLPLAIEWQWFDQHCRPAVVVDETELGPNAQIAQLGFAPTPDLEWNVLHGRHILPRLDDRGDVTVTASKGVMSTLTHFRSLAQQIASKAQLQPIVEDVVNRWSNAFCLWENVRRLDFNPETLQIRWQTLADFVAHPSH